MQRLPTVLQNEIWTYVHGDRAFWKTQYQNVLDHLLVSIERAETFMFLCQIPSTKSHLILEFRDRIFATFGTKFIKFTNHGYRMHARSMGFSMFADSADEYMNLVTARVQYDQLFLS